MKVLLVGSGGREHALAWALAASDNCNALYCAPGNAGIEQVAECVNIGAEDVEGIVEFVKTNAIDFVVVPSLAQRLCPHRARGTRSSLDAAEGPEPRAVLVAHRRSDGC